MSRAILNLSIHDLHNLFMMYQWGLKYILIDECIWFMGEEDNGEQPPTYGLAIYDKHGFEVCCDDDIIDDIIDEADLIDAWIHISDIHDLKPMNTVTQMSTRLFTDIIIRSVDNNEN